MTKQQSSKGPALPGVSMHYAQTGTFTQNDALGMRPMQARAFQQRGEQYLLIKSPPASGKSRALMFIALDKVQRQGLKQALVLVPERSIGASFHSTALSEHGFWADWVVEPKWNLCDSPGEESSKVESVRAFLASDDAMLICTHATFRFAFEKLGAGAFDERLLAIDEFHHVSANPENKLGAQLSELLERDKTHMVAMTGSYFRGDAEAVLRPEDESRFAAVTYTYYEQLNGYEYLKDLDIGYYFYSGTYFSALPDVLIPGEKTIIHIPNVNSRESTKNKYQEVDGIFDALGVWEGRDEETGFHLIRTPDGLVLRVADLVDDEPLTRERVARALRDPAQKNNRDHVDMIIALGMAKEGFDWIWCEHALTIGYRSSLTEIVQIVGRTTRDAPGKYRARFTNLIAEPTADQLQVAEAVNDTLKAIAASLLMEQVLAPRFEFRAKRADSGPDPDVDYGPNGYQEDACNVGVNTTTGEIQMEVRGLVEPKSAEAKRICKEDIPELVADILQRTDLVGRGIFDQDMMPEQLTQVAIGKIVRERFPQVTDPDDNEAIRQRVVAEFNTKQGANAALDAMHRQAQMTLVEGAADGAALQVEGNTQFIDGVRRFALDVRELDIELIDAINPFQSAYAIMSKTMNEDSLRRVEAYIGGRRTKITPEEAAEFAVRASKFKATHGRLPNPQSPDAWERRLAEGVQAFVDYRKSGQL